MLDIPQQSISAHDGATVIPNSATNPDWFNRNGPNAPLAWFGGKHYLARWIIEQMPDHRVYVEPFGGMGNVLLKKQPSEVEIFNDLDGHVVNFFQVIRNRESFDELTRRCELTPYSRQVFNELCETPEPSNPIDKAWWFFVRCRQARGGLGTSKITKKAWAMSTRTRRKMPEPVSKYLSALDGLDEVADRFRQVVIEHLPAIELIKKYDAPDVLWYCDPPYPASTRSGGQAAMYSVEMNDEQHEQLLKTLTTCVGKIMISSYDSPLYNNQLRSWRRVEKDLHVQFSNSGGRRKEILWMNH